MNMQSPNGHCSFVTGVASGLRDVTAKRLANTGVCVALFGINAGKGAAHHETFSAQFVSLDVSELALAAEGKAPGQ